MPAIHDRHGADLARGQAVAQMRAEMGLSLRRLGKLLDVSPNTISRWEEGGCSVVAERAVRSVMAEQQPKRRRKAVAA